jgi:hypothetical protein
MGLTFASKKVVMDFLLATFLIVVVPLLLVGGGNLYLKDAVGLSELEKVAYSVVPTIIFMNIVIGVYIYKVVKDPENYKKDPPLVMKPKKE